MLHLEHVIRRAHESHELLLIEEAEKAQQEHQARLKEKRNQI